MNKYIEDVKKFHKTFGHPINEKGSVVELSTRQLRVKLIHEETEELAVATDTRKTFYELCKAYTDAYESNPIEDGDNVDKVEEVDAYGDIIYVTCGGIITSGHSENFDAVFQNIQDSNMSKGCKDLNEVYDTQKHYSDKSVESYVVEKDGIYIVLRKSDNKVLKNRHYVPTDLEKYV
jgi:predicted HAD superfamily Cof-like phosphohydrolase